VSRVLQARAVPPDGPFQVPAMDFRLLRTAAVHLPVTAAVLSWHANCNASQERGMHRPGMPSEGLEKGTGVLT